MLFSLLFGLRSLGLKILDSRVLESRVLGLRVLGLRVLGLRVLGLKALESRVLESKALGTKVLKMKWVQFGIHVPTLRPTRRLDAIAMSIVKKNEVLRATGGRSGFGPNLRLPENPCLQSLERTLR